MSLSPVGRKGLPFSVANCDTQYESIIRYSCNLSHAPVRRRRSKTYCQNLYLRCVAPAIVSASGLEFHRRKPGNRGRNCLGREQKASCSMALRFIVSGPDFSSMYASDLVLLLILVIGLSGLNALGLQVSRQRNRVDKRNRAARSRLIAAAQKGPWSLGDSNP